MKKIMTEEIWVLADHDSGELNEVTLEILGEACDIARRGDYKVCAVVLGDNVRVFVDTLASYGAERVYLAEHESLALYVTDIHSNVVFDLAVRFQPGIMIFGGTANGNDLAASLASRLDVPVATDCVKLELNEERRLIVTRPSFGDQVYLILSFSGKRPYLTTMRPGAIGIERKDPSRTAEIIRIEPEIDPASSRTRIVRRFKPDPATILLSEADIIVAGGGGARTKEEWTLIEEFARILDASVGGSRVALDLGFIPQERLIGQSGAYVAPKLYIGIGISGATHHTQGMKDAKSIIAINKDRAAPIFNMADLKVVYDLKDLLPWLIDEIRGEKGGKEAKN